VEGFEKGKWGGKSSVFDNETMTLRLGFG